MCKLSYQLLVATMNQDSFNLFDQMNLDSNAIIINQCDRNEYLCKEINGHEVNMYSFAERGVGLSRNTALMRATADIIEFADDDMIFVEGYKDLVIEEFNNHPEADAILFSLESQNPERPLLKISRFEKISKFRALKYGCARLAIRREKVIYNNLAFSLLFGGGARYGSGEDTIFLQHCVNAGLKIYCSPVKVADVKQDSSSWFNGFDNKYYKDKGALFAAALPKLCYLYAVVSVFKMKDINHSKSQIFRLLLDGIMDYKKHQRGD